MSSQHDINNPDVPRGSKRFIPLESNPEIFTTLLHSLGLSPALSFYDVYSLSDADLLSFCPRPCLALLLVFPVTSTYESHRKVEDDLIQPYSLSGDEEATQGVVWFKQTIANACGLIGLLHAVYNVRKENIVQNSDLDELWDECRDKKADERAEVLYDSAVLERAHGDAGRKGNTKPPGLDEDVDLHYVCFVKSEVDGELWELDGRRRGPLKRGKLEKNEDVLSEKALDFGVRKFIKREEESGGKEMRFSLVGLGPNHDDDE